jgi:hypothetical protein
MLTQVNSESILVTAVVSAVLERFLFAIVNTRSTGTQYILDALARLIQYVAYLTYATKLDDVYCSVLATASLNDF